ncbi:hypothetical protein FQR65_LT20355 [Abscondita terminalis]|nr:hypothetical protein FQR65_LT20355 [Abscondita terminalis]
MSTCLARSGSTARPSAAYPQQQAQDGFRAGGCGIGMGAHTGASAMARRKPSRAPSSRWARETARPATSLGWGEADSPATEFRPKPECLGGQAVQAFAAGENRQGPRRRWWPFATEDQPIAAKCSPEDTAGRGPSAVHSQAIGAANSTSKNHRLNRSAVRKAPYRPSNLDLEQRMETDPARGPARHGEQQGADADDAASAPSISADSSDRPQDDTNGHRPNCLAS